MIGVSAPDPHPDAPLELGELELAPAPPESPLRLWLAGAAGLELLLALGLWLIEGSGWCPSIQGGASGGEASSCGTLFRPRLSRLGPVPIGGLASLGAALSVIAAWDLLLRGPAQRLARLELALLGAGAGVALGLQALAWRAQGALCPPCLLLALVAVGVAALAAALARREGAPGARGVALAGAVALALALPPAALRGGALAREDAQRRAAALETRGPAGPGLLLFERPGCPFCQALLPDALGDPLVLPLLARTSGLQRVGPDDPRAEALGIEGAPVLVLVDAEGRLLGPAFQGYAAPEELAAWLGRLLGEAR